jgi:hypothetical protein
VSLERSNHALFELLADAGAVPRPGLDEALAEAQKKRLALERVLVQRRECQAGDLVVHLRTRKAKERRCVDCGDVTFPRKSEGSLPCAACGGSLAPPPTEPPAAGRLTRKAPPPRPAASGSHAVASGVHQVLDPEEPPQAGTRRHPSGPLPKVEPDRSAPRTRTDVAREGREGREGRDLAKEPTRREPRPSESGRVARPSSESTRLKRPSSSGPSTREDPLAEPPRAAAEAETGLVREGAARRETAPLRDGARPGPGPLRTPEPTLTREAAPAASSAAGREEDLKGVEERLAARLEKAVQEGVRTRVDQAVRERIERALDGVVGAATAQVVDSARARLEVLAERTTKETVRAALAEKAASDRSALIALDERVVHVEEAVGADGVVELADRVADLVAPLVAEKLAAEAKAEAKGAALVAIEERLAKGDLPAWLSRASSAAESAFEAAAARDGMAGLGARIESRVDARLTARLDSAVEGAANRARVAAEAAARDEVGARATAAEARLAALVEAAHVAAQDASLKALSAAREGVERRLVEADLDGRLTRAVEQATSGARDVVTRALAAAGLEGVAERAVERALRTVEERLARAFSEVDLPQVERRAEARARDAAASTIGAAQQGLLASVDERLTRALGEATTKAQRAAREALDARLAEVDLAGVRRAAEAAVEARLARLDLEGAADAARARAVAAAVDAVNARLQAPDVAGLGAATAALALERVEARLQSVDLAAITEAASTAHKAAHKAAVQAVDERLARADLAGLAGRAGDVAEARARAAIEERLARADLAGLLQRAAAEATAAVDARLGRPDVLDLPNRVAATAEARARDAALQAVQQRITEKLADLPEQLERRTVRAAMAAVEQRLAEADLHALRRQVERSASERAVSAVEERLAEGEERLREAVVRGGLVAEAEAAGRAAARAAVAGARAEESLRRAAVVPPGAALRALGRAVRRRAPLAATVFGLASVVSLAAILRLPFVHEARAIVGPTGAGALETPALRLAAQLLSGPTLDAVAAEAGLPLHPGLGGVLMGLSPHPGARLAARIEVVGAPVQHVEVWAQGTTEEQARRACDLLAGRLVAAPDAGALRLLVPAEVQAVRSPWVHLPHLLGWAAALALLVAFVVERRKDALHDPEDVVTTLGVPTLAVVGPERG